MPTIGIRSIPKDVYVMLKERANVEHRSLNQEVIWLLKVGLAASGANDAHLWASIDRRRLRLSESSARFSDSVKLIRKDRSR